MLRLSCTATVTDEHLMVNFQCFLIHLLKEKDLEFCVVLHYVWTTARDSRTAKKKQKREAQLSRAADVELAEISLEQQVLKQLTQRRLSVGTPAVSSTSDWVDIECALAEVSSTNIVSINVVSCYKLTEEFRGYVIE